MSGCLTTKLQLSCCKTCYDGLSAINWLSFSQTADMLVLMLNYLARFQSMSDCLAFLLPLSCCLEPIYGNVSAIAWLLYYLKYVSLVAIHFITKKYLGPYLFPGHYCLLFKKNVLVSILLRENPACVEETTQPLKDCG